MFIIESIAVPMLQMRKNELQEPTNLPKFTGSVSGYPLRDQARSLRNDWDLILWPSIWSILIRVPLALETCACSKDAGLRLLKLSFRSSELMLFSRSSVSSLSVNFYVHILSITERSCNCQFSVLAGRLPTIDQTPTDMLLCRCFVGVVNIYSDLILSKRGFPHNKGGTLSASWKIQDQRFQHQVLLKFPACWPVL